MSPKIVEATQAKLKYIPKNIDQLSSQQIQQLLINVDQRKKILIKELQIKFQQAQEREAEQKKETSQSYLQSLIQDNEYLDELDEKYQKEAQLREAQNWIKKLNQEQIKNIIEKTNKYNRETSLKMNVFFHEFADQIFKSKVGQIVKFTTINRKGQIVKKMFTVRSDIIKLLIDFYREGYQHLEKDQVGSDVQIEYEISIAFEVEFIENPEKDKKESNNKKKKVGAYFNYLNKIQQIDLSRQQIGRDYNEHMKLSQTQCFLFALQQAGFENVDFIKSQINVDNIDLLSLKNVKNIKGLPNIRISILWDNNKTETKEIISNEDDKTFVPIGLFKDHFFYNEETKISQCWIKNYEQYKDNKIFLESQNLERIRIKNDKPVFCKFQETRPIFSIIKLMWELNYFEEIKELNKFNFKSNSKNDVMIPSNIQQYIITPKVEDDSKPKHESSEASSARGAFDQIYFGDFEAFTTDDNGEFIQHEPFLLCFCDKEGNMYNGRNFQSFINHIKQTEYKNILIYFHNLSYDATFILNQQNLIVESILDPDNRIVQFNGKIDDKRITFRDSLRVISSPLKNMPKMFLTKDEQKNIFKEMFPYNYYTKTRYIKRIGNIDEAMKSMDGRREDFIESIKNGGAYLDDETFDMQKYALYYCEQDVRVLQKCVIKFAEMMKSEFDMNLFESLSISSISLKYQMKQGCFDGCVKVSGVLRQYLQQFIKGGRVQCADNKKIKIQNKKVSDFDAVSLYPSAQNRVFYPTGECKALTTEQIQHYNNPQNLFKIREDKDSEDQNSLFLSVKLDSTNIKKYKLSLLSHKDENGIRQFVNECDPDKIYYLSHIVLQDLVKFQGYKYQIIEGLYFEGRNYKINEVSKFMFQKRKEYKALKNPVQEIYKLMMNSSYGKTCEGVHDTQTKIMGEKNYLQYVFNNFNVIKEITEVSGGKYLIKENVEIIDQSAFNYIGVLILDQSKRLMNEVCCLAEDLDIEIYYTDTDSMHIEMEKLDILAEEFEKIYNVPNGTLGHRKLVGKDQGQFHTDFSSDKGEVLYADYSIFLGKKCYCDRLVCENGQIDYHIRMKGINSETIKLMADELYEGDVMKIYEKLYDGEEIEFDLVKGSKVIMQKNKELNYINLNEFKRVICFK